MKFSSILLLLFLAFLGACAGAKKVDKSDGEAPPPTAKTLKTPIVESSWLGRNHYVVRTKMATYYYDPVAGGFSSITDPTGQDWVQYRDKPWGEYPASAASSYRGLPNLVFGGDDDGAGHPGHKKTTSSYAGNQIMTESTSGEWAWTWTFDERGARLDVTKAPADRAYWFLYEGPVGGKWRPEQTWWATDVTEPSYVIKDHYAGDVHRARHRYMIFGLRESTYAFYMAQLTPDAELDHISMLGNDDAGAKHSNKGMVVAGFGRDAGAKPLLKGPHSFYIGFAAMGALDEVKQVRKRVEKLYGE